MAYQATAYDFDMFENHQNAAPRINPERKKSNLKKVAPKSDRDKRAEEFRCIKKSVALIALVSVIFSFVALQISAGASRYELIRKIDAVQSKISIAEAENVRLSSELNGITSITIIDNYAMDILGMTKLENYQVECVEMSEGDRVIFSAAKIGK